MKILKNDLQSTLNIRTEKDFPVEGIEFIDINPLILQKETLQEIIDKIIEDVKLKNADYIVMPEARGFLFGMPIAYQLNLGAIPVRKKGKLPPTTVATSFDYEKEYGKDYLELPKLVNEEYTGKRFYIIDDILATGNTLKAIENAVKSLGGLVVGKGVVMNIVELNNMQDVFSLIDVNEE